MKTPDVIARALLGEVLAAPRKGKRRLVAIAGPPASGKSTLASRLVHHLTAAGCPSKIVPMDGFHLDNRLLTERGLLAQKGAPQTFDAAGLLRLTTAMRDVETAYYPVFDRNQDIAIAGAGCVDAACDTVVIEGNYLLYDAPMWRDLAAEWDISVRLVVDEPELETRLIQRWRDQGLPLDTARARARGNDLQNAKLVERAALPPTITVETKG